MPAGDQCAHFSTVVIRGSRLKGKKSMGFIGVRTLSTTITTSVVQDLKEKNRWRSLYDALIIHCVALIVAEPEYQLGID
jgi:hypothetical protein